MFNMGVCGFKQYLYHVLQDNSIYLFRRFCNTPCRPFFQGVLKKQGYGSVGVEVGVEYGVNALDIIRTVKPKRLYLVDPYVSYFDETINKNVLQDEQDDVCNKMLGSLNRYIGGNVFFIRSNSVVAVDGFEDNSLDWVYIDGNHSYDFVKQDVLNYFDKVMKGGMVGGHDFGYGGVMYAVVDVSKVLNRDINFYGNDWWMIK